MIYRPLGKTSQAGDLFKKIKNRQKLLSRQNPLKTSIKSNPLKTPSNQTRQKLHQANLKNAISKDISD
jgi:hypothetical protein